MNVLVQLGKRIQFLRKQKGMSQEDRALESGVNKNYLSDLERGRRNPSLLILNRICYGLDIDLATLFKGI